MEIGLSLLRVFHILGVVFMSAPLYALIIVNERALLGPKMIYSVDRYVENMIRRNAVRCYVFQITVLATGIGLVILSGQGLVPLFTNWVLAAKTVLILLLMALLSYVHFSIQPRIEKQLARVQGDPVPEEVANVIRPLRVRRKRLAASCLFFVLTTIILGLQIYSRYPAWLTIALIGLAAVFSYRVYKSPIRFGWI